MLVIKEIHYDEINIGDSATMEKRVLAKDVESFAKIVNDKESFHVDEEIAKQSPFKKRICHGMHIATYISELIGKKLPGFGTVYCSQSLNFVKPVYLDSTIIIKVKVIEKLPGKRLRMMTKIINKNNDLILDGEAIVKTSR